MAGDNGHPWLHKNIAPRNRRRSGFIHPRFSIAGQLCGPLQPEVLPMTTISSRAIAAAFASMLLMGSAFAQTPAPAPAAAPAATSAPMAPAAEKKAQKPRTAASLECSKEADAKGLKGKERKKFRNECRKAAGDKK
jgi:psiF repeat